MICSLDRHARILCSSGEWLESQDTMNRFIDELCVKNGSTAEGRKEAFRRLTGYRQKAPVLISERMQYLMFPTLSPDNPECVWLSYSDILDITSVTESESSILFVNGTKQTIPFSARSLRKQMKRCEEYLRILDHSGFGAEASEESRELLRQLLSTAE